MSVFELGKNSGIEDCMLNSPFRLPRHTRFGLIESAIEKFIGLNILERLYEPEYRHQYSGKVFLKRVLEIFNVSYEVARGSISSIPDSGPSIIVANHPFGGIDGLALGSLLTKTRPNFKLLVNQELEVFDAMTPWLFKVDILSGHAAKSKNLKVLADCTRFLKDGNCMGVFPAGEVSSLHVKTRKIIDP